MPVRNHAPDAFRITNARYQGDKLVVWGTSSFAPVAVMTFSVDGFDAGSDPDVAPLILVEPMTTYNDKKGRYELFDFVPTEDPRGRRVTISTNKGGAFTTYIE